jgi:hypothetical protein
MCCGGGGDTGAPFRGDAHWHQLFSCYTEMMDWLCVLGQFWRRAHADQLSCRRAYQKISKQLHGGVKFAGGAPTNFVDSG